MPTSDEYASPFAHRFSPLFYVWRNNRCISSNSHVEWYKIMAWRITGERRKPDRPKSGRLWTSTDKQHSEMVLSNVVVNPPCSTREINHELGALGPLFVATWALNPFRAKIPLRNFTAPFSFTTPKYLSISKQ